MNRLEELQARINDKSKSVFDYAIDWFEWSAKKNLAIAEDVTEFTVTQLRLPAEADGFTDYRLGLRDAYGELGETLKHHGEDYVSKLKGLPAEVRDIFAPEKATRKAPGKKVAPKAAAKPKATKKKAAKPKAAAAKKVKAKPAKAPTTA
jgi:hypothetical protein